MISPPNFFLTYHLSNDQCIFYRLQVLSHLLKYATRFLVLSSSLKIKSFAFGQEISSNSFPYCALIAFFVRKLYGRPDLFLSQVEEVPLVLSIARYTDISIIRSVFKKNIWLQPNYHSIQSQRFGSFYPLHFNIN